MQCCKLESGVAFKSKSFFTLQVLCIELGCLHLYFYFCLFFFFLNPLSDIAGHSS